MQVIGATNGYPTGQWTVSLRSMGHWRGKNVVVNHETVTNVGYIDTQKKGYNYAAGGVGMFAGAALFGAAGLVVGGLLPKGFKGTQVEFAVELSDGTVLRAKGTTSEYEKLVKWSMEAPGTGISGKLQAQTTAERAEAEGFRDLATDEDRERIRAELAAEKAAKKSPEAKAERKARIKEVQKSGLPFAEKYRQIRAIEDEYR